MKAEEVEPRLPFDELHDPRLLRLGPRAQAVEKGGEPGQGGLGLTPAAAHHQQIIGVTDQTSIGGTPGPVQPG